MAKPRIDIIRLDELQDYLEFVRCERELQVVLTRILELDKWKLNNLNNAKHLAIKLKSLKNKCRFKTDKEMMAQIHRLSK